MNVRRLAVFSSIVLVAGLLPEGGFAGQKYTPPPPSTPSTPSTPKFTNNTRPLPQSKPVPLQHDKPLADHLAPSASGSPSKGKENVQDGVKGLLTPYFTNNAQGKLKAPLPEKKTTTQETKDTKSGAGTQEAKVDRPVPFGGPNLRARGKDSKDAKDIKDAKKDRQPSTLVRGGPSNR
jgi:hypothetical protein